jgi:hypothetical protein
MNPLKFLAATGGAAPAGNQSLYDIIDGLGLTTNLNLCLDAGDSASYDPGVQTDKWLDTSGGGYDFFRGSSTGSDAADPTFNGSAGGLSSSEYFSFDGGDWFTYDSAVESWMQRLSRDGALWSAVVVVSSPAGTTTPIIFGTKAPNLTSAGMDCIMDSVELLRIRCANGTTNSNTFTSTAVIGTNTWKVIGLSLDESVGSGGLLANFNGSAESGTSTYATPSTSGESPMVIGARGAGTLPFYSGTRLACLAIWEGTALTAQNLTDIYDAIKGRFGL